MAALATSGADAAAAFAERSDPSNLSATGECEEAPMLAGRMRVLTYNVRRFKGTNGECTVAAVGDALARLSPTVVALNEVDIHHRPEALNSLAERLGGFSVAFFGHVRGRYGNALLSRYPIVQVRETHLRGGTEVGFPVGTVKHNGEVAKEGEIHRIARGLLECDIEVPVNGRGAGKLLTVAVTHLDHISEEQREVQVAHVVEALGNNAPRALLVGDMNALTRSDYMEHEWGALEERAASNQWSPPQPARCLETLAAAGFRDAFVESRGGAPLGPPRGVASAAPEERGEIFTAHVGHPLYRIDYCFAANTTGLAPVAAQVHTDVHLSDHFPVAFDFDLPSIEASL